MPQIVCNLELDVSVPDTGEFVLAKQGDRGMRVLSIRFTSCGRPLALEGNSTVLLTVGRDGGVAFSGRVDEKGCALFVLPDLVTREAGDVPCEASVIDVTGGRLSSATFTVRVEPCIATGEAALGSADPDIVDELLAAARLYPLTPTATLEGFEVTPLVNRKYVLDLSDERYTVGPRMPLCLHLPQPEDEAEEAWLLIYCHAPFTDGGEPLVIDWGDADRIAFHNGAMPTICFGDFDIVCTYSQAGGYWQVGVVQYEKATGAV